MHIYGSSAVIAKGSKLRAGAREEGEEEQNEIQIVFGTKSKRSIKM